MIRYAPSSSSVIDPKVGEGEDTHLERYSERLNTVLDGKLTLIHKFLDVRDEAKMEHTALYSKPENVRIISNLFTSLGLSPESFPPERVVVASVGTSSTHVYHKNGVLGAFYAGSSALVASPHLAHEMMREIYSGMTEAQLDYPLVFCNSIGYFVNDSINLSQSNQEAIDVAASSSDLDAALKSGNERKIEQERKNYQGVKDVLNIISKEANASNIETILMVRRKPNLNNDWIGILCEEVAGDYPNGVYVVDFGGGGPDLYFYNTTTTVITNIDKDRSLRHTQDAFVVDMLYERMDQSNEFQSVLGFLRSRILPHATQNNIHPIACIILQTGKARQQHYLGHMLPSCEMMTHSY